VKRAGRSARPRVVVARKRAASQKKSVGKALTTNVRQTADADRANAFVEFRKKKKRNDYRYHP
jgi:hypothetical protein